MNQEVLVLNSDYEPLNVCNVRRAIVLVYLGKADILHEDTDHEAKTMDDVFITPSVVKLRSHVKRPLPELKLSRRTIFARDNYTCQYCGSTTKDLTIDPVIPKHAGGPATWDKEHRLSAATEPCTTTGARIRGTECGDHVAVDRVPVGPRPSTTREFRIIRVSR